jgi:transposase
MSNGDVAEELGITRQCVGKWRKRFTDRGLDGLLDESRPGAPRSIRDEDVERVVTLTLESTPEDAPPWSTRSMARRSGLRQSAVSRIWRAFGLQPHRSETFKLSKGPLFIEKVPDMIARGIFTSRSDLRRKLLQYIRAHNKSCKPFMWRHSDPKKRIRSIASSETVH